MNKQEIVDVANEELAVSKLNDFAALGHPNDKIWSLLDIGVAAGDDPLFAFFKEDIGEFYWTPTEAYRQVIPDAKVTDQDLSVLSMGFYMDKKIKDEQKRQKNHPCMRWMYSRNNWKAFIQDFSKRFTARLEEMGIQAASLEFTAGFGDEFKSEKYGRSASWSYRHTAYVAGQGTFGLSENFISRYGTAARYTSVIVKARIEPDQREYSGHYDWCSYYVNGRCRTCQKRCPANAVDPAGHNKIACHDYAEKMAAHVKDEPLLQPRNAFWCGLCQTAVSCQDGIPKDIKRK